MMNRRIRTTMAVTAGAALLATGLATAAFAQGPGRRGGFGPGMGRGGFPLGQLELTDTQRQQVRDVMQRHREDMQQAGQRLRDARDAQRQAVETFPVNEGLIRSTSQTLANAQTDMALVQARVRGEIWTLLTPEQQARAKELQTQRESRMKQRMQRRQPR